MRAGRRGGAVATPGAGGGMRRLWPVVAAGKPTGGGDFGRSHGGGGEGNQMGGGRR
jgi:hypothetical protein